MSKMALPSLPKLPGSEKFPGFEMTYFCNHKVWVAYVRARNQQAAAHEGALELAAKFPDFDYEDARCIRAIQTQ